MRRLGPALLLLLVACSGGPEPDPDCRSFGSCCVICSAGACGDLCQEPGQDSLDCATSEGCACEVDAVCEPVGCCRVRCGDGTAFQGGDFTLDYCQPWGVESCAELDGLESWEAIEGCLGCDPSCLPG